MYFSAETLSRTCRIHCNITAAYDDSLLGSHDGCSGIFGEGTHEVGSRKIFVSGEHSQGLLAGDVHEAGKTCA